MLSCQNRYSSTSILKNNAFTIQDGSDVRGRDMGSEESARDGWGGNEDVKSQSWAEYGALMQNPDPPSLAISVIIVGN